jgi:hypothetical protein
MATTGLHYLKGNELWLKKPTDGTWLILNATNIGTASAIGDCVQMSNWNALFAGSIGNFTTASGSTLQDTENTIQSIIANYPTSSQLNTLLAGVATSISACATKLELDAEVATLSATIGTLVPAYAFNTFWEISALTFGITKEASGDIRIDSGSSSSDVYLERGGTVFLRTQSGGVKVQKQLTCQKDVVCQQDVIITGNMSAATKAFVIDHPGDPTKQIAHSCWEGPSCGTMYKFREVECNHGSNFIDLPNYFNLINKDPMVFSNPVGHFGMSYGSVIGNVITLVTSKAGKYNILVCADRCDPAVKNWTVIRNKPETPEDDDE